MSIALFLGGAVSCASGGQDPKADRLTQAEAANRTILAAPTCEALDADLLDEVAPGVRPREAAHDPIASTCTWRGGGRSVVLAVGIHTSLNAPLFEEGDVDRVELADPRVRRAGIVDDRGDVGTSALMIELADNGGYLDLSVDGPGAAVQMREHAAHLAEDLLADLAP